MNTFYHRTNNSGVLSSSRILSLKHLAKENPDLEIEVEPDADGKNLGGLLSRRKFMRVEDALEKMEGIKNVDDIFLSKDVLPPEGYGKYVIEKKLTSPVASLDINLIPNEYKTKRAISLKNNATVYVPVEEMDDIISNNPGLTIRSTEELKDRGATLADRVKTLYSKFTKTASEIDILFKGTEKDIKGLLSPNATIVGSEGIGIDVKGSSDRDILVPYKTRKGYDRLVDKLKENGFGLEESEYNSRKRDGYKVYSYRDGNVDVDVALVHGGKAPALADHVRKLRSSMSDEDRDRIRKEKTRLSNAWLLRNYRYNRYKKGVDEDLGLTQFHE